VPHAQGLFASPQCKDGRENSGVPHSVLSVNLKALMAASDSYKSQRQVAAKAGMDQRTVGRILNEEHSPTLVQLERLAGAFNLMPWQLLVPGLDPHNLPVTQLTETERNLYSRMREIASGFGKLDGDTDPP